MPFSGPEKPICHEQIFFGTNHHYYFHLPIGPFHCAKLKKNSYSESRVKKWPKGYKYQIVPNEFFPRKTTNKVFMYLLAPFILQNLKKIIRANPEL